MALTQAPPLTCSISLSDLSPGLDSVSLKVTTPGQNCSFTLIPLDSGEDGSECRRTRGATEVTAGGPEEVGGDLQGQEHICLMEHLEAGTSYRLQIRSQDDQHVENITMATSKSRPPLVLQPRRLPVVSQPS